jgi:DNA topoisomerase-3
LKVCIAEKPSVAREIAQVIGAKVKKTGIFEGNGYR